MPLESDLRKQGRIDPGRREIRNVSEVSEINRQLELFRGCAAKFWFFSVSHCMLEIHLYRTGGHKAILLCVGTDLIRCSSHTWKCDLAVIPIPNPRGYVDNYYCEFFAVRDSAADVEFTCSIPVLYLGFDSPFSGDGLCPW